MQKNYSASDLLNVFLPPRRPARVVEEARLESVYTGNRIEGSNPSVSATLPCSFFINCLKSYKKRQEANGRRQGGYL